jgi:hypothetical protein
MARLSGITKIYFIRGLSADQSEFVGSHSSGLILRTFTSGEWLLGNPTDEVRSGLSGERK